MSRQRVGLYTTKTPDFVLLDPPSLSETEVTRTVSIYTACFDFPLHIYIYVARQFVSVFSFPCTTFSVALPITPMAYTLAHEVPILCRDL